MLIKNLNGLSSVNQFLVVSQVFFIDVLFVVISNINLVALVVEENLLFLMGERLNGGSWRVLLSLAPYLPLSDLPSDLLLEFFSFDFVLLVSLPLVELSLTFETI